ncbi:TMA22 [Candida pseudojiufengensis]|uniref:TMA22 n=1 Tax=Candida pseudojiufengensis TaxID=497109 RepID=UPI002224DE35|nr:TMA22 [Candida pseudojiufengensis]KAI5965562.1 TMA22 [Candida pseudojiufengensis]
MSEIYPKRVTYCEVCSFPPEFCEYGASINQCVTSLKQKNPELFSKLYPNQSTSTTDEKSNIPIENLNIQDKDLLKKQQKEELKQQKELEKKQNSKIIIKRIERNKKKHIISIIGLEVFNIDSKKLSKTFASKFATGTSVVKNSEKKDEILIQGDVSDEAKEYIESLLKKQPGLEDVKVEQIDDKKKVKKANPIIGAK